MDFKYKIFKFRFIKIIYVTYNLYYFLNDLFFAAFVCFVMYSSFRIFSGVSEARFKCYLTCCSVAAYRIYTLLIWYFEYHNTLLSLYIAIWAIHRKCIFYVLYVYVCIWIININVTFRIFNWRQSGVYERQCFAGKLNICDKICVIWWLALWFKWSFVF